MKRITLLFFCFSLVFCLQNGIVWAEGVKIGVLNMKKLQQNSVRFQKIREGLKKKFNALQKKAEWGEGPDSKNRRRVEETEYDVEP